MKLRRACCARHPSERNRQATGRATKRADLLIQSQDMPDLIRLQCDWIA